MNSERPAPTAIATPDYTQFRDLCHEYGLSLHSTVWLHERVGKGVRGMRTVRLIWGSEAAGLSAKAIALIQHDLAVIRATGGEVTEEGHVPQPTG